MGEDLAMRIWQSPRDVVEELRRLDETLRTIGQRAAMPQETVRRIKEAKESFRRIGRVIEKPSREATEVLWKHKNVMNDLRDQLLDQQAKLAHDKWTGSLSKITEKIREELRQLQQDKPDAPHYDGQPITIESVKTEEYREPWELRCVSLLAHILTKEACEEWLGDLKETRQELERDGYPRWAVIFVTLGRVFLLGWSLLRIRYQDLVSAKKKTHEIK